MTKKPARKIITFDWAIKTVLRDKANFDVLEGFLTALFRWPIVILELLEREGNRTSEDAKYNRVDLLAKTADDERIIIEVQYLSEMDYWRRLAYGTAKTIVENLGVGEPYANVKKVYSVNLLYFNAVEDGDDYVYHGKTEFTGLHTHNAATLKRSLTGDEIRVGESNVFPEYFLILLKTSFTDVVRDDLDEWVYAFKNNEVPDEFTAPGIGALKEKFDYLKLDERERRALDKHLDYFRSEWGMVESAKREVEDARREGREEGREEGHRKGRKEGRQEGRQEGIVEGMEQGVKQGIEQGMEQGAHEKSREIARALKQKGWSQAEIAEVTGISLSEPENL